MNDVVTLEQWGRLYDLGKKFKKMKPWEKFRNIHFFAVEIEGQKTAYFNILGNGGQIYGFSMYLGENGLNSLIGIAFEENINRDLIYAESETVSMFLYDREEVSDEQYNIIKELGLKFRGKNNWICFEKKEPGFYPYILEKKDADNLEVYFEKFLDALEYFSRHSERDFDLEKREIYLYSCREGVWSGDFVSRRIDNFIFREVLFNDEVGVQRIKKQRKNNEVWEVDCFLSEEYFDEDSNRVCFSRCMIIVERDSTMILGQKILGYNDGPEVGTSLFLDTIMKLGRPKKVIFSDLYVNAMLGDACSRCKIESEIGDVYLCNSIQKEMEYYMQNGEGGIHNITNDDISFDDRRMALLVEILSQIGIDMKRFRDAAENMSYDEFQKFFNEEFLSVLENLSEEDYNKLLQLEGYLEEYGDAWYDEYDDFFEYDLRTAKDKLWAINDFFGKDGIQEDEYEEYDKWIEVDFSDREWKSLLKSAKKAELLNYAGKIGAIVDKSMSKDMLISVIISSAMSDKHNLRNALSKNENALMKLLLKKAKIDNNKIFIESFEYAVEDLISLFKLGLVDIGLSGNEGCLILEVYPLSMLADMWKGR